MPELYTRNYIDCLLRLLLLPVIVHICLDHTSILTLKYYFALPRTMALLLCQDQLIRARFSDVESFLAMVLNKTWPNHVFTLQQ